MNHCIKGSLIKVFISWVSLFIDQDKDFIAMYVILKVGFLMKTYSSFGQSGGSVVKNLPASSGDPGSAPGLR